MVLRAVGENHDAAHALGYKVVRVRMLAIMFGGATSGLGGAQVKVLHDLIPVDDDLHPLLRDGPARARVA